MIKINLLGSEKPKPIGPSGGGSPAPKAMQVAIFVGALIICFGIVGVISRPASTPFRRCRIAASAPSN
jgi:hypothetical protein